MILLHITEGKKIANLLAFAMVVACLSVSPVLAQDEYMMEEDMMMEDESMMMEDEYKMEEESMSAPARSKDLSVTTGPYKKRMSVEERMMKMGLDKRRIAKGNAYVVLRGALQADNDVQFNGGMAYIAHGFRFFTFFRSELEVGYGEAEVEKIPSAAINRDYKLRNRNLSVFSNLYFDVASRKINYVVPYVGLGLGYIHAESKVVVPAGATVADGTRLRDDLHGFGYSGLAGFSFLFAKKYHLDLGYRYVGVVGASDIEDWHEARIGISRSFTADYGF